VRKTLEYWAALGALFVFRFIPLRLARAIGVGLSVVLYYLLAQPRRTCLKNLRLSFPEWDEAKVHDVAHQVYRNLGMCFGETLKLSRLKKEWVEKNIRFVGADEVVDRAVAEKRGVVMVGSHFGNWELHGSSWALKGRPVAAVAFPQSNKKVDELVLKNRNASGMKIIYTGHRGTVEILNHLREGKIAAILSDQNAGKDGLRLPFFGRDCSVAKAPAVLARKTGAALIPAFLLREKDGTFTNVTLPEIPIVKTDDVNKDVETITRAWLKVQEDFIREHPDQYFWVHRRWKHYENK
jgi:KDO2-lipid IV(A) lauroyltransferase